MAVHTALTPGMAAIWETRDSGTGSRSGRLVPWAANRAVERMTRSEDWAVSAEALWKAPSMVSVRMKVPETRVTARATASAVPRRRVVWARAPRTSRRISLPQQLHVVDGPLGRGFEHLVDHAAVGQEHDAVGVGGGDRVVGDHDDGLVEGVDGAAHEGQQFSPRLRVQVAGGLVGEDDLGLRNQGPGGGDPLLLAARELG